MTPRRLVLFGEGEGEEKALPELVKKLLNQYNGRDALFVDKDVFRTGDIFKLAKDDFSNWKRWVQAAIKRPNVGAILVVSDGDADHYPAGSRNHFCAWTVAVELASQAAIHHGAGKGFSLAAVVACQEYESWLIAGTSSLAGKKMSDGRTALRSGTTAPGNNLELAPRDAKGWLSKQMPNGYKASIDQVELTRLVELEVIRQRGMRSFKRLEDAVRELIEANRSGRHVCTPA